MKVKIVTILSILVLFSACSFAPRKINIIEEIEIPENYHSFKEPVSREDAAPVSWWKEFNDEDLNAVVEEVLENNLDLQIAVKRVDMLSAQFKATRGILLPAISTTGNYTKSEGPVTIMEPAPEGLISNTSIQENEIYSLRTGLNFELDIWGKLRRTTRSANEAFKASKEDLNTVYLGIIAQTIILYYDIEVQRRDVDISTNILDITEQNYNLIKKRYEKGVASKENLEIVTQALGNMQTKLQTDEQILAAKLNQLSILLGEYPSEQNEGKTPETEFLIELREIPVGVPSDLLKNRSDIISASHSMEAARQQAGAAFADFFPSISLSAGLNFASMSLDELFDDLSLTKSISGDVNHVLFAGGSKIANYKQKRVIYDQSVLMYKKTVLTAFADVEDAMISLETAELNQKNSKLNYESSKRMFEIVKQKYLKGTRSYSQLLESEMNMHSALSVSYVADKQLISARIQLYTALGGKGIKD